MFFSVSVSFSFFKLVFSSNVFISAVQQSDLVVQQSDLVLNIYIFPMFISIMIYHRILNIVPCATQ